MLSSKRRIRRTTSEVALLTLLLFFPLGSDLLGQRITVTKVDTSDPGFAHTFNVIIRDSPAEIVGDAFTLRNGESHTTDPLSPTGIEYGIIKHTEDKPGGSIPDDVVCNVPTSEIHVATSEIPEGDGVGFILPSDTDVQCTFRNVEWSSITVSERTAPIGSAEEFSFRVGRQDSRFEVTPPFQLKDGESETSEALTETGAPYAVRQPSGDLPIGWVLAEMTCNVPTEELPTGDGLAFYLRDNARVECTFRNVEQGPAITTLLEVRGGSAPWGGFPYTAYTSDSPADVLETFVLLTDGDSYRIGSLEPGAYGLVQDPVSGWVTTVDCNVPYQEWRLDERVGAVFQITEDEAVVCSFTNVPTVPTTGLIFFGVLLLGWMMWSGPGKAFSASRGTTAGRSSRRQGSAGK